MLSLKAIFGGHKKCGLVQLIWAFFLFSFKSYLNAFNSERLKKSANSDKWGSVQDGSNPDFRSAGHVHGPDIWAALQLLTLEALDCYIFSPELDTLGPESPEPKDGAQQDCLTALQHPSLGTHCVMGMVPYPVSRSPGLQNPTGCAGRRLFEKSELFENPIYELYSIYISKESFWVPTRM